MSPKEQLYTLQLTIVRNLPTMTKQISLFPNVISWDVTSKLLHHESDMFLRNTSNHLLYLHDHTAPQTRKPTIDNFSTIRTSNLTLNWYLGVTITFASLTYRISYCV